MDKIKISVILCALLSVQQICCDETLSLPLDEFETSEQQDEIQPSTQTVKRPNMVIIDLSECTCTGMDSCDLAVLKSPLMDITCGDQEYLCCPITKSPIPSTEEVKNDAVEADVAPRSNVRVYSITPTVIKDFDSLGETSSRKLLGSKSKRCACKARSSCPHKYIDYGFGFYCSYNTVRCCIPEESPVQEVPDAIVDSEEPEPPIFDSSSSTNPADNSDSGSVTDAGEDIGIMEVSNDMTVGEMNSTIEGESDAILETALESEDADASIQISDNEANKTISVAVEDGIAGESEGEEDRQGQANDGELVITEVTNWTGADEDDYQKEGECFCLPIQKCQVEGSYDANNMIERRRDTLCPGDLVQCCGRDVMDEITKKRDDVAGEYDMAASIKSEMPASLTQEVNQYPTSSDTFPLNNNTDFNAAPSVSQEVEKLPSPSVLPVPYPGYQPPGYYKGYGYQYPTNTYPSGQQVANNPYNRYVQQPQPIQNQYQPNGAQNYRPWTYSNQPSQFRSGQEGAYPPTYADKEASRHKSGGIFETLSKMLG